MCFCPKKHQGTECLTESQPCGQAPLLLLGGQFFSRDQIWPKECSSQPALAERASTNLALPRPEEECRFSFDSIHFSMDGDLSRKSSLAKALGAWPDDVAQDRPLLPARRQIKLLRGQIILSSRSATKTSPVFVTLSQSTADHTLASHLNHTKLRIPAVSRIEQRSAAPGRQRQLRCKSRSISAL